MASSRSAGAAPPKPVYVLHGPEEYLRDLYRRRIVAEALGEADPQLGVCRLGAEAELATVLDELRTPALMAPRRVVIIEQADAFLSAHRQAMEQYLRKPSETATLVLVVDSWNRTQRISKLVAQIGEVLDCSAASVGNLRVWLEQAARRRGKALEPQAARMLAESVGPHLAALEGEVDKLCAYVGERRTISAAAVSAVTVATAEVAAFALENALVAGRVRDALRAAEGLVIRRGDELAVLGRIASQLRKATRAQAQRRAGQPIGPPVSRMPDHVRRQFLSLLDRRPMRKLQADLRRVMAADLAVKSGADARATLQQLVVALCT